MRDPNITGPTGRAWQATLTADQRSKWPASITEWLVHRPGSHPFWSWYLVSLIHLRDVPGIPSAVRSAPENTHELLVFSLDPKYTPDDSWCVVGDTAAGKHRLSPADLDQQFASLTDDQSAELAFLLVRGFVYGQLVPDQDYRHANMHALEATAEHIRQGRHRPS